MSRIVDVSLRGSARMIHSVVRLALPLVLAAAPCMGCAGGAVQDGGPCSPSDADSDSDADGDADADGDTDGDSCSSEWIADQFNPAICPDLEAMDNCVFFVDLSSEASDPDGLSWETAFRDIQHGILFARCALLTSETCQVWVAKGIYHVYRNSRQDTVRLDQGLRLYGGFAGDETTLEERDCALNETVLDGSDPEEAVCNVYHVVTGDDDAVIDGFTITGGQARGKNSSIEYSDRGGGMLNVGVSPTISQCVFLSNDASSEGGGIYAFGSFSIISDCLFQGNAIYGEEGSGAALSVEDTAEGHDGPTVSGCVFEGNMAGTGNGGAVVISQASAVISETAFTENAAPSGAAITISCGPAGGQCSVTVDGCDFSQNNATGGGSAVNIVRYGETIVRNSRFHDNAGGGMTIMDSAPVLENCIFSGNHGDLHGAIEVFRGQARLINITIHGNTASEAGGAGGVYVTNDGEPCSEARSTISNSIVWSNLPVDVKDEGGAVTEITCSDVGGGWIGAGNIDADPHFVDIAASDYHLMSNSPCIDAGDGTVAPALDMDGNERCDISPVQNTGIGPPWVDIGALEVVDHR